MRFKTRGFSFAELMTALTLLTLVIALSYAYMSQSQRLYRRVNAKGSADVGLRRAALALEKELSNSGKNQIDFTNNGNGANYCGDAIWFLSAEDPASEEFVRKPNGTLFWQKNVLYYLTVPLDHDERYKIHCDEMNRVCSHKVLVRLVIDNGIITTPNSPEDDEETLLTRTQARAHFVRPNTLDLAPLTTDPRVVSATVVASSLLDNSVSVQGDGREIRCKLSAGLIEDARKNFPLGKVPFPEKSFTLSRTVAVILPN